MLERYTVSIRTTDAPDDPQVVMLESEHALLAAVESLEQLAISSLKQVISIQIEPQDRPDDPTGSVTVSVGSPLPRSPWRSQDRWKTSERDLLRERASAMSAQELTDRYTQEQRKLQALRRFGRQSKHFLGYPATSVMNVCRWEMKCRGIPIPSVQPAQDHGTSEC